MDDIFIIFAIVYCICSILSIILFFKVWGMTNDIRDLKKDHFNEGLDEDTTIAALRNALIFGDKNRIKSILFQNFVKSVENGFIHQVNNNVNIKDRNGVYLNDKERKDLAYKTSMLPYVEMLEMQFKKIGEELPPNIKCMTTYGDYFNLFTKKDLKIKKGSAE